MLPLRSSMASSIPLGIPAPSLFFLLSPSHRAVSLTFPLQSSLPLYHFCPFFHTLCQKCSHPIPGAWLCPVVGWLELAGMGSVWYKAVLASPHRAPLHLLLLPEPGLAAYTYTHTRARTHTYTYMYIHTTLSYKSVGESPVCISVDDTEMLSTI